MITLPTNTGPRLSARALVVRDDALLLVNAYPGGTSDLWCAPGGGVEMHQSLTDNVRREVYEETGFLVAVGGLVGVNEFHDQARGFHQVDLFFRASIVEEAPREERWIDPDGVVDRCRFFTRIELRTARYKPDRLAEFAFLAPELELDPLEILVV